VVEANGPTSTDYRYCYDAQNRLVARNTAAACTSSPDETYDYDAAGNRTTAVEKNGSTTTTTTFAYNADGQLCRTGATSCGTPNLTYDKAGRTRAWNGWWLSYDPDGRLASACRSENCLASADRITFTYDAEGRRTSIASAPGGGTPTTVELRYQGTAVVEERDAATNTLLRSYVVDEAGSVVKLIIPSGQPNVGTYLVSWNGHGDALALHRQNTDGSLTLANSYSYSSWGAPTTAVHNGIPDLAFRYLYVGRYGVQWDNQLGLGLHYMSARHYAPALGRFIQPDPSRLEINHYAYAANGPVTMIDPDGRCGPCIRALEQLRRLGPSIASAVERASRWVSRLLNGPTIGRLHTFEKLGRTVRVYGQNIHNVHTVAGGYLRFVSELGGGSYNATNVFLKLTGKMPWDRLSVWTSDTMRVVYRASSTTGGPVVEIINFAAKTYEKVHFK
jgi:RHS repeat-associated protein